MRPRQPSNRLFPLIAVVSLLTAVLPYVASTADAQENETATYYAETFDCAPGFDPASGDAAAARANCTTPLPGLSMTVATNNPEYPGDMRVSNALGQVSWGDIPLGTAYSITQAIPSGYGDPWIYCESSLDPDAPGTDVQARFFQAPGGTMDMGFTDPALASYRVTICMWFNVSQAGAITRQPLDDLEDVGEIAPAGTGRISVTKRYCPTGFELTDPFVDRSTFCQLAGPQATFTLTYGAGTTSTQSTNKDLNAIGHFTQWMDVPAGALRITEEAIEGYATLGVACIAVPENTTPTTLENAWSPENGWAEYTLPEEEVVVCEWFNVRLPGAGDAGAVTVYKEYCPARYVPPAVGEPYGSNDCSSGGPARDLRFALTYGDQADTPPAEQDGRFFAWYGIPGGALSITEEPPLMYETAAVYCDSAEGVDPNNPSAAAKPPPNRVEHDGNTLNWDLLDGYYLNCIWQNVPVEDAYGNLLLFKWVCPEGYDFGTKPVEEVLNDCAEQQPGVQFTLDRESGEPSGATTDQGAVAAFPEQPPGNVSVVETPLVGYTLGRVDCTRYALSDDPVLPDSSNSDQETVTDNTFPSVIYPGFEVACVLFDVPVEPAEIEILKYSCTPDYGLEGAAREDVLFNCTTPVEAIVFQLLDGANSVLTASTDANGRATVAGIASGPLVVFERAASHQALKVYCGDKDSSGIVPQASWQELDISADSVEYQVQPGARILCYWINDDVDYPEVIVHKHVCIEPSAPHEPEYDALRHSCTQPLQGVTFELTAGGTTESQTTSATGDASWNGVPVGEVTIREAPPQDDYPVVIVFCAVHAAAGEQGEYQQIQPDQFAVELTLPASYFYIECDWFNFEEAPAEGTPSASPIASPLTGGGNGGTAGGAAGTTGTGGGTGPTGGQTGGQPSGPTPVADAPATLIITKYACADDYDLYDPEANPPEDCAVLTDDITFTLSEEGQEPGLSRTTGDDGEGKAAFEDLEPGAYLLTETLPENMHSALIYTCESDQREFPLENPFVPFAYAGPDGQIGVTLIAGETLECDWLNIPAGIPGASVTLTKYSCPGVQVIRATCTLFPDGATLALTPLDPGAGEISLTTGPDGTVTDTVPLGTYEILEVGTTWCLIDSEALNAAGRLVVEDGVSIEIAIYNCGGG